MSSSLLRRRTKGLVILTEHFPLALIVTNSPLCSSVPTPFPELFLCRQFDPPTIPTPHPRFFTSPYKACELFLTHCLDILT